MGHEAVAAMCAAIEGWAAQLGKPKRTDDLVLPPEGLDEAIHALIGAQVRRLRPRAVGVRGAMRGGAVRLLEGRGTRRPTPSSARRCAPSRVPAAHAASPDDGRLPDGAGWWLGHGTAAREAQPWAPCLLAD